MSQPAGIGDLHGGPGTAASADDLAGQAKARASLFGLLALLFRRSPKVETLIALRGGNLREALALAGMRLEKRFFTMESDLLADTLGTEFAELFLVPGRLVSPHESVQTKGGSGLLRGPETADVRAYYEYVGFHVDEATPMEPDHISVELEFVGHLASEEADAWQAGESSRAIDALRYQNDFLRRHLGRWAFDFLRRVEERAGGGFYAELARLASEFLAEQMATVPQLIARLEGSHGTL